MRELELLKAIAASPKAQLEKTLAEGKKAIGVMPYFCPEELVYAAGMMPFGLWGASIQASESKRYFPAFICSVMQSILETGQADAMLIALIPICRFCFQPLGVACRMVGHPIEDNLKSETMSLSEEVLEIFHCSELWIDRLVVAN